MYGQANGGQCRVAAWLVAAGLIGSSSNTYTLTNQDLLIGPYSLPNCNSTIFECYDPG